MCKCGCGELVTFYGWKIGFAKYRPGHQPCWLKGLTKQSDDRVANLVRQSSLTLKRRYNNNEIVPHNINKRLSDEQKKKISDTLKHKFATGEVVSWRKGLKKHTDERIAASALKVSSTIRGMFHSGTLISWRKDKNNVQASQAWSTSHSVKLKKRYKDGFIQWSTGLTSETSDSVRLRSESLRTHKDHIINRINKNNVFQLVHDIDDRPGLQTIVIARCLVCNDLITTTLGKLVSSTRCLKCFPCSSNGEQDIADFVASLNAGIVITNDRKAIAPYELDIYVPEFKFAIEFNGLYWHAGIEKENYHQLKTDMCIKAGISLFHVFEDEWRDKRMIVQSMIEHRLKNTKIRINARDCSIVDLTLDQRRIFFTNNHIDGDVRAKTAVGLMFQNELVAAISVRTPHYKKYRGMIEIARMCCKVNTHVSGAVSRLVSVIKSRYQRSMITYSDCRFGGSASAYVSAGFVIDHETKPRFWWTDHKNRYDRFLIKASKSSGVSQDVAAIKHGVEPIFGCRNYVLILS